MDKQKEYFSQSSLWANQGVASQHLVADHLIEMIPEHGVSSILDAGCGNGVVTNKIPSHLPVVGCDLSLTALQFVKKPRIVADLQSLPFSDLSFDLVLASDVIEHAPPDIYPRMLTELMRVARRYLLVAVPYREILQQAFVSCPHCGTEYHAHHHQRTYTEESFRNLFKREFGIAAWRLSGEAWIYSDPRLVEAKRAITGLDYDFVDAICPACGQRRGSVSRSPSALAVQRRFEAFQAMNCLYGHTPIPPRSEIIGLFVRGATSAVKLDTATVRFAEPPVLNLDSVRRVRDPQNYPSECVLLDEQAGAELLSLPIAPVEISLAEGSVAGIEIFDSIQQQYVPAGLIGDRRFHLPEVSHDARGALIRLLRPNGSMILALKYRHPSREELAARTFGLEALETQNRINSLHLHLEEIEARREAAERLAQSAILTANRDLESKNETIAAQDERIDSLLHRLKEIEAKRETAERLAQSSISTGNRELESKNQTITAQDERINSLLFRFEEIEARREAAERLAQSSILAANRELETKNETITELDKRINSLLFRFEETETGRVTAERLAQSSILAVNRELESKNGTIAGQDERIDFLLNHSAALEQKREVAEAAVLRSEALNYKLNQEIHAQRIAFSAFRPSDRPGERGLPKSILVLSHMYPRSYHPAGGVFVHAQVKALRAVGCDVRVLSGEPLWINTIDPIKVFRALQLTRSKLSWETIEEVPLLRFPYVVSNGLPFLTHAFTYSAGASQIISRIKKEFDFELVHAHTSFTDGTAGVAISKRFNVPLVITEHTGPFSILARTGLLRRITRRAVLRADAMIAVSDSLRRDIRRELSLQRNYPIRVVPNVVDTEFFRANPRPKDDVIRAVWVGHFVPIKRVPVLLEAFKKARRSQPRLRLTLVGSGEAEQEIKIAISQLGLTEFVSLTGHVPLRDLPTEYAKADFVVISSQSETFGVVAIEAMSCGKPVLTTDCGGPSEVINDPALGIVSRLSADDLSNSMLQMCSLAFDSALIRRVTELRYSPPAFLAQLADAYIDAQKTSRARAAADDQ